jgi:hypothetical protein
MSYLRKVVGCGLSPENQNLQEFMMQRAWERNARQNVKFENGGSCSLRPKSKPKNSDSNNDAKLGRRNSADKKICSNYSEKVVVSESGVKFLPKTLKPKICKQIKTTPN